CGSIAGCAERSCGCPGGWAGWGCARAGTEPARRSETARAKRCVMQELLEAEPTRAATRCPHQRTIHLFVRARNLVTAPPGADDLIMSPSTRESYRLSTRRSGSQYGRRASSRRPRVRSAHRHCRRCRRVYRDGSDLQDDDRREECCTEKMTANVRNAAL